MARTIARKLNKARLCKATPTGSLVKGNHRRDARGEAKDVDSNAYDRTVARQLKIGRDIMRERYDVLKKLAE